MLLNGVTAVWFSEKLTTPAFAGDGVAPTTLMSLLATVAAHPSPSAALPPDPVKPNCQSSVPLIAVRMSASRVPLLRE